MAKFSGKNLEFIQISKKEEILSFLNIKIKNKEEDPNREPLVMPQDPQIGLKGEGNGDAADEDDDFKLEKTIVVNGEICGVKTKSLKHLLNIGAKIGGKSLASIIIVLSP